MAKYSYGNTLVAFEVAKSGDLITEFQSLESVSGLEEKRTNDAIKFPAGETTDVVIAETPAQRVDKIIGFGAAGELELQPGFAAVQAATAADLVLTNADVVLTNADVVLTNADVVSAAASLAAMNGSSAVASGTTPAFDMNGSQTQHIKALTANPTPTLSNIADGRSITVIIIASGADRTVAYNANWNIIGSLPTTIPTGKALMLSFVALGAANTDIYITGGLQL